VEKFVANKQVFEKLSPWRLYTSIRTWRIWLNDAYMRHSAPCAFERMTHICVNQRRRCSSWHNILSSEILGVHVYLSKHWRGICLSFEIPKGYVLICQNA